MHAWLTSAAVELRTVPILLRLPLEIKDDRFTGVAIAKVLEKCLPFTGTRFENRLQGLGTAAAHGRKSNNQGSRIYPPCTAFPKRVLY